MASKLKLAIFGMFWLIAISVGLSLMTKYENTPGAQASAPSKWPVQTGLELGSGTTLVMLVHPHCPCTRASLAELSKVLTKYKQTKAYLVFLRPHEVSENWEKTNSWQTAKQIPNAAVVVDSNGLIAQQFNSKTSGQTLVYNKQGKLIFTGGITGARGQMGDNPHLSQLIAALDKGGKAEPTYVFGCSLLNPTKKE